MPNDQPVRRNGLTCKTFTLALKQQDPKGIDGGEFTLEVTDTKGDDYVLVSVPVSDYAGLVVLLLRRIADQKGQAGWSFDADWYASLNEGIIVG